jgi:hypothetical protein
VRLAGAYRLIAELTGQVERLTALNERLSARVDELERRARQDSSKLDALRDLFNGHAWKPPGLEPAG